MAAGRPLGPIPLALGAWLLLPSIAAGQDRIHVPWPLIDFLVCADSTGGVRLLASANLSSAQGESMGINELAFDPMLVRQWTARVLHGLDSTDRSPKPAALEVIGPLLPDLPERAVIAVGYDPAGMRGQRFFLFWEDSTSHHVWRAPVDGDRVRTLLDALDSMALRSAVRQDSTRPIDSIVPLSRVQVRPELLAHPVLRYPPEAYRLGVDGRVWLEMVIDTLGRPEMQTARVLFSDEPGFSRAALRMIAHSSFRPARVEGRAVRVWIRMPFYFHFRQ